MWYFKTTPPTALIPTFCHASASLWLDVGIAALTLRGVNLFPKKPPCVFPKGKKVICIWKLPSRRSAPRDVHLNWLFMAFGKGKPALGNPNGLWRGGSSFLPPRLYMTHDLILLDLWLVEMCSQWKRLIRLEVKTNSSASTILLFKHYRTRPRTTDHL